MGDFSFYFGLGYEDTLIQLTSQPTAQVTDFTNTHGRHFQQLHHGRRYLDALSPHSSQRRGSFQAGRKLISFCQTRRNRL